MILSPKSITLVQELAKQVVREDAARMSNWHGERSHDVGRDAVNRYAHKHGLSQDEPQQFRKATDDKLNDLRWDSIQKLCTRYKLALPL